MGDEKEQSLTMHGLNSARGYLQSKVADRVKTRYTPELSFEVDHGIAKSIETARILREVLPPDEDETADTQTAEDASDQTPDISSDLPD